VIIADTRSSMVAAGSAAAVGCAFDFDVDFDFLPAQRATIRRGRLGLVKFGAQAPGKWRVSAWEGTTHGLFFH
jgi:hypothetical protein